MTTLDFQISPDFYNNPNIFGFQEVAYEPATNWDEFNTTSERSMLLKAINDLNNNELDNVTRAKLLQAMIIASINQYRLLHSLPIFKMAGVPTMLMRWQNAQYEQQTGKHFRDVMMNRPHHSANLGSITSLRKDTEHNSTSNLFMRETLSLNDIVAHVDEYSAQDALLPDYIKPGEPWTTDDLMTNDPNVFTAFAADVVAAIAGSWTGKAFLMQAHFNPEFIGVFYKTNEDNQFIIDIMTASYEASVLAGNI